MWGESKKRGQWRVKNGAINCRGVYFSFSFSFNSNHFPLWHLHGYLTVTCQSLRPICGSQTICMVQNIQSWICWILWSTKSQEAKATSTRQMRVQGSNIQQTFPFLDAYPQNMQIQPPYSGPSKNFRPSKTSPWNNQRHFPKGTLDKKPTPAGTEKVVWGASRCSRRSDYVQVQMQQDHNLRLQRPRSCLP